MGGDQPDPGGLERNLSGLAVGAGIAVVAVLGVGGFFLYQSLASAETTTTIAAAPATSSTTLGPTTTAAVSTTTTAAETTTSVPEADPIPFVGWWKATDVDGSHLDLRITAEGTFTYWDSASEVCEAEGFDHSPETWSGTATFVVEGTPVLTASGLRLCFPYGADDVAIGELSADFVYDQGTDMLESVVDEVRYERTPLSGAATDANPLVGSWEATDSDGTRVTMTIHPDGTWESVDTRSGGCERKGFIYATWSATGVGTFDLADGSSYEVLFTTFCHPPDSDAILHSPDVTFTFVYRPGDDTAVLQLFADTVYTRVP